MAISISRGERIFNGCNVTFMIFLSAWFIVPFVVVASTSVVGAAEAARRGGLVLIPETFDLSAYQAIFAKGSAIIRSYGVTLFRVVVGTALNLLFTAPFAYALSKRSVPGRTPITMFVFFTILISGGLIPTYLVVRYTGLYNTLWALVIPQLVNPWWMLIMRNFFYTIGEPGGVGADRWRHAADGAVEGGAAAEPAGADHDRPVLRGVALEFLVRCLHLHSRHPPHADPEHPAPHPDQRHRGDQTS